MYEDDYENERELIQTEYPIIDNDFKKYCFCTRELIDIRECSCKYITMFSLTSPCALLADILACIPQCISNNIKLCFI